MLTVLFLSLLVSDCGDGSGPSAPAVTTGDGASLVVAIPPPNATPISHPRFSWAANFTVNLFERAGVGVELTEIVVELTPPVVYDSERITLAAQTTRVEGGAGLSVPLSLAFEDAALNVQVAVRGVDDRGNSIEALGRLVVIPAQRP